MEASAWPTQERSWGRSCPHRPALCREMEVAQRFLRSHNPFLTLAMLRWGRKERWCFNEHTLKSECNISIGFIFILILKETVKSSYSCFSARSSIVSI